MIRWWDAPDTALAVLARVDDSDVAQGVGTAVLGYHALAKALVADLPGSTLVDPALVWSRLDGLDLEPVAKALASATAPLMGTASGRYGELLAEDLHEQSRAGLETLMAQMGATGLPMPMVLERAVEVVGVPPRHMGAYAKIAKERVVPAVVKADAADRALMLYAAHLGAREATGPVPEDEMSKAVAFKEAEHPRDGEGQFATKGKAPDSKERRLARMARAGAARRAQIAEAEQEAISRAKEMTAARSLTDLARALAPQRVAAQVATSTAAPRIVSRTAEAVEQARPTAAPAKPKPVVAPRVPFVLTQDVPPLPGEAVSVFDFDYRYREQSMLVPRSIANAIAESGGFTTEMLRQQYGWTTALFAKDTQQDEVWAEAASRGIIPRTLDPADELVLLVFDDELPVAEGHPLEHEGVRLASNSRWVHANPGDNETWGAPVDPMQYGKQPEEFDVMRFHLGNSEDFADVPRHVIKAHAEKWDGRGVVMVNRDEGGQFATRDATRRPDQRARRARMARADSRRRAQIASTQDTGAHSAPVAELRPQIARTQLTTMVAPANRVGAAVQRMARQDAVRTARSIAPAAEPVTAPKGRAQADILFNKAAALIKPSTISALYGRRLDDVVGKGEPRTLTPYPDMAGGFVIRPGRAREVLDDWGQSGSSTKILDDYGDLETAEAAAARHRQDYLSMGYSIEQSPSIRVRQTKNGYAVEQVTFGEDELPYVVIGSKRAMAAFASQQEAMTFSLVAFDVHRAAEYWGINPTEFGDHPAPVVVLEVSFPDDDFKED